ncbi:8018_t:CDS:1, partial [Racocetra persica]
QTINDWSGTVIVLKVSKTNEIIGGFIPYGIELAEFSIYHVTNDSFIFSLKNETQKESILSRVNNRVYANNAVLIYTGKFPSFGEYDLKSDGFKKCYCEKIHYNCPIRKTD